MNNPFPFSNDNKRYHTLYFYNLQKYGGRVYKAVIDAGFSCPNIDGTKGSGGCIFCDGGSGYFTAPPTVSVEEQLKNEIARIREKSPDARICAYFQSHTNTYGTVERLQKTFSPALAFPEVCSIAIGTRPDCLDENILDFLSELNAKLPLTIELGLQTTNDLTAEKINRGYPFSVFEDAMARLKARNIRTAVHIINGLPGESHADMLQTAQILGEIRPDAVKIQLLHVIRGTVLEQLYIRGEVRALEKSEYVEAVVAQLELLPNEIVIERITGDGDRKKLVAPLWSADKISVLGEIDKLQKQLNSYQGKALD